MKVDWIPSERLISFIKYVMSMRKAGLIWEKIEEKTLKKRVYMIALVKWYKEVYLKKHETN